MTVYTKVENNTDDFIDFNKLDSYSCVFCDRMAIDTKTDLCGYEHVVLGLVSNKLSFHNTHRRRDCLRYGSPCESSEEVPHENICHDGCKICACLRYGGSCESSEEFPHEHIYHKICNISTGLQYGGSCD